MNHLSVNSTSAKTQKTGRKASIWKYTFALFCFMSLAGYQLFKEDIHSSIMGRPVRSNSLVRQGGQAVQKATIQFVFGVGEEEEADATEEEDDDCKNLAGAVDKCEYVKENCQFSDWFNYMELRYCTLKNMSSGGSLALTSSLYLFICLVLLSVLGQVGGTFFVASLSTISKKLSVSSSVSGMTFLAFGNGSPDIFSALAASRANNFNMLQGALMGANVCLSTFVLGIIVFSSNGLAHTSKSFFWRSMIGYAVCMACVIGFCADGHVSFMEGLIFVLIYVVYIGCTVVYLQLQKCKDNKKDQEEALAVSRARRTGDLQVPLMASDGAVTDLTYALNSNGKNSDHSDEGSDEEDDDLDHTFFMEGVSYPHPDWAEQGIVMRIISRFFYFAALPFSVLQWLSIPSTNILPHKFTTVKRIFTLFTPIGIAFMLCCDMYNKGDFHDNSRMQVFLIILCVGVAVAIVGSVFFFFVAIPANVRYAEKREEIKAKVEELTLTNPADSTIDRLTTEWDLLEEDENAAHVTMHVMHVFLSLLALAGSILWLSIVADEIVSLLQTVGIMSGVSSILIGLTVVALANSLPDAISNHSLAKAGHYETSFAAAIFAPLLTTLVGLGLSITTTVKKQPGEAFHFHITTQLIYTWCAVCLTTLVHMVVFPIYNYNPPRWYGVVLMVTYVLFLIGSVLIEVLV